MKKLLFVINNFETGGIQKSLVELLNVLKDKYDLTVYVTRFYGQYCSDIPRSVKVIKGGRFASLLEYPRWEYRKVGGLLNYLIKLLFGFLCAKIGKKIPAALYCFLLGKIKGNYDAAISYSQPIGDKSFHNLENEIVLFCTKASKKITFLHCDYGEYGGNTPYNHSLYIKFDVIAAVSNGVSERFRSILHDVSHKVVVVNNCCDFELINERANINPLTYSKISLVSVSRISPVKGLERCFNVVRELIDDGFIFEWHIVGGGDSNYEAVLRQKVESLGLNNVIIFEGSQNNPYRFMLNADYLFLPSLHEAAPMVFNEACSLGIPIISTNTLSAKEFVSDRGVGIVCENDEKSIKDALNKALTNIMPKYHNSFMSDWNKRVVSQFENSLNW